MRKILHATEQVTVNSGEIFLFIGVLLLFALVSSSVVLYAGLSDPNRNQFKLILHCIMIVTSVVPPELPMELSLAVTNSLSALAKELIFCTEPYRIPLAGRVSMICFDKTGTVSRRLPIHTVW
jgi:manganese-transporting P-type ATPase